MGGGEAVVGGGFLVWRRWVNHEKETRTPSTATITARSGSTLGSTTHRLALPHPQRPSSTTCLGMELFWERGGWAWAGWMADIAPVAAVAAFCTVMGHRSTRTDFRKVPFLTQTARPPSCEAQHQDNSHTACVRVPMVLPAATLQVVAGLVYCHSQGVWHLDVKPDNILIAGSEGLTVLQVTPHSAPRTAQAASPASHDDSEGAGRGAACSITAPDIKITDFGCAATHQWTAQPCGTLDYACPEALGHLIHPGHW